MMSMFDDLIGSLTPVAAIKMELVVRTPFQAFQLGSDKLTSEQIMELRAFVLSCGANNKGDGDHAETGNKTDSDWL